MNSVRSRHLSTFALATAVSAVAAFASNVHAGKLVMSEICYDEVGSTFDGEWIEIYNGSSQTIDLSNYKIGDEETKGQTSLTEATFQFPSTASIAPGEVQIVSSYASRFKSVYGFAPTYECGSTVAADNWADDSAVPNMSVYTPWDPDGAKLNMSNTNDQALILDGSDNLVDGAAWGSTFYFDPGIVANQASGQSVQRIDPNIDTDTAADWQLTPSAPVGATWTSKSTPGTLPVITIATWTADADGAWIVGGNWQDGSVPNGPGQVALLGSSITAARTVTLLEDETLGTLKIDCAAAPYAIDGTANLILDLPSTSAGSAVVQVLSGVGHTIHAPMTLNRATNFDIETGASLAITGPVTSGTVGITKSGGGTLTLNRVRASSLSVAGGSVAIAGTRSDDATSVVSSLTLTAGSKLDLGDNALVVDYAGTPSPLAAIAAAAKTGQLTSARAIADSRYAVAVAEASTLSGRTTFGGVTLDADAVVAEVTLAGDTNIDGNVDFSDLLSLARNYGLSSGAAWTQGDSNYDSTVGFGDLLALARNYGGSFHADAGIVSASGAGSDAFTGDWALAASLAPEPATLAAFAGLVPLVTRRRRSGR